MTTPTLSNERTQSDSLTRLPEVTLESDNIPPAIRAMLQAVIEYDQREGAKEEAWVKQS